MDMLPLICIAAVCAILFVRWGTRSIPHAIVFVVMLPIVLMFVIGVLMFVGENHQSERPYHITKSKPL